MFNQAIDSVKKLQHWPDWLLSSYSLLGFAGGWMISFIVLSVWLWLILSIFSMLLMFFFAIDQRRTRTANGSPWARLRCDGDDIVVNSRRWNKASIDLVVMGKSESRAWIQLLVKEDDTVMAQLSFAALYFPAVEAFFRLRLPHATIKIMPVLPCNTKDC